MPSGFTTSSDTQQWTDKMEKIIECAEGQIIAQIASLSYISTHRCLVLVLLCVCNTADANGCSDHRKTNLWIQWQTQSLLRGGEVVAVARPPIMPLMEINCCIPEKKYWLSCYKFHIIMCWCHVLRDKLSNCPVPTLNDYCYFVKLLRYFVKLSRFKWKWCVSMSSEQRFLLFSDLMRQCWIIINSYVCDSSHYPSHPKVFFFFQNWRSLLHERWNIFKITKNKSSCPISSCFIPFTIIV